VQASPTDAGRGVTRVEYLIGVPLHADAVRQWPQMRELVRGRERIAQIEAGFPELRLEIGRRHQLPQTVIVEWSCDYGDGRLYRNVTIAELHDGAAVRITDYWGAPTNTPAWRRGRTDPLEMPPDGIWKDAEHLGNH
jgi:hypothetical protein